MTRVYIQGCGRGIGLRDSYTPVQEQERGANQNEEIGAVIHGLPPWKKLLTDQA